MKNRSHDLNLRTILDSMPCIIALVDEKARVEMINRKGAGLMAKKAQSLEGQLCGDVFNCLNAQDGNICGLSPACSQCPLRTRVISTFQTGASLTDEEGRMNLATNGYHAMEENGGELMFGLKEVPLDECDTGSFDLVPGDYACLTISDTGSGMNKALTEKIFDPYGQ